MRTSASLLLSCALLLLLPGCPGTGSDDESSTETETGGDDGYAFADAEPSAYTRVDRHGMPAVNTAVVASKQAYNEADPSDDANGDFVAEITASVEALHMALDDDLTGLGLTPCAPDVCVTQAAPLVVPDVLKLDLSTDAGFPNGRRLTDPVIDVTLAVILLDLSIDGQTATSLVGALNPAANDQPFESAFPYLAPAHTP
jgi:hypothetical protein